MRYVQRGRQENGSTLLTLPRARQMEHRLDPENCESLCYGCHAYMGSMPYIHLRRKQEIIGEQAFDLLRERSNDLSLGRMIKKNEAEARKHYLAEFKRMQELRAGGETGRIEFESFT